MNEVSEFFKLLFNSEEIVKQGSLILLVLIVFAETGLFFCFFLPGDYLLFMAGLYVTSFEITIYELILLLAVAAISGNYTGYYFGKYLGNSLMKRKENFFFKKQYIINTETAFKKYGGNALIIARFLPVIRTFAPIFAGISKMGAMIFAFYNILGAILWVVILCSLGYFLGQQFPQIHNYVEYIIIAFILITSVAVFNSYLKLRKDQNETAVKP